MAVTPDKPAPYAPVSAVLELVERYRARGLPTPITAEVLTRAGITDSLNSRTLQALQLLDLIDDSGSPTSVFEAIRKAPEGELKARMAEWLNGAYADALQFIDPATADEVAVRDAFRNYNPIGMQPRMVTLFMGLYAAAGVRTTEKNPAPRPARNHLPSPKRAIRSATQVRAMGKQGAEKLPSSRRQFGTSIENGTIPEPISGLLARLPSERGWTQADRDKFMTTFGAVLDFCFPIVSQATLDAAIEDTEDNE